MVRPGQDSTGERIRDLRRQRGLSQAQLAHPELSDSYVSLIESGKRSPTRSVVELLAAKLDCSPTFLINGVTSDQLSELKMGLSFARLALENGEVDEALRRFKELQGNEHLHALDDLRRDVEHGYALALEATGQLAKAVERFRALLDEGEESAQRRISMQIALCRCLREAGDLSASVEVGEACLAKESSNGWDDDVVELGATLLGAYIRRGDRVRSGQLASRLMGVAEHLGTSRATVAACWNASIVAEEAGRSAEALRLTERALAIQSETGDPRNLSRLRLRRAMQILHLCPQETEKARDLLLQADRHLAQSSASATDRAECMIELARAEIMLQRPEEALRLLAEPAVSGMLQSGEYLAVEWQYVAAWAQQVLGRPVEATGALASAADLLEEMRATQKAAQAWFDLAEQLSDLEDQERSKSAYRRALACAGL